MINAKLYPWLKLFLKESRNLTNDYVYNLIRYFYFPAFAKAELKPTITGHLSFNRFLLSYRCEITGPYNQGKLAFKIFYFTIALEEQLHFLPLRLPFH